MHFQYNAPKTKSKQDGMCKNVGKYPLKTYEIGEFRKDLSF